MCVIEGAAECERHFIKDWKHRNEEKKCATALGKNVCRVSNKIFKQKPIGSCTKFIEKESIYDLVGRSCLSFFCF